VSRARSTLVGAGFRQAALASATFAQSDLRNADFSGADLRGACFDRANLEGAHLEGAILTGATFSGVPIAVLLACGLAPRDLLSHRAGADQRCFRRLLSGPPAAGTRFAVTAQEAAIICQGLGPIAWDRPACAVPAGSAPGGRPLSG
jgi:hypothetical protein